MNATRLNIVLAVLLAVVLVAALLTRRDNTRPNFDFLPDMQYSPAYQAYAENPNFKNGRTLQTPPEGTLAQDAMPLHFGATPAEAVRAGVELNSPIEPDDKAAMARGENIYRVYCQVCHGPTGAGDGPVTKRGVPSMPVATGNSVKMKDGQIFHILTYGRGNMASYAGVMTPNDRWSVIRFLRTLQETSKTKTPPALDDSNEEAPR